MQKYDLPVEGRGKRFTLLTMAKGICHNDMEKFHVAHKDLLNFKTDGEIIDDADTTVIKTYRILVTNSILVGTRVPYDLNVIAIKKINLIPGARLPFKQEIFTLIRLSCLKNKCATKRLPYSSFLNSLGCTNTFTYCLGENSPNNPDVAGLHRAGQNIQLKSYSGMDPSDSLENLDDTACTIMGAGFAVDI